MTATIAAMDQARRRTLAMVQAISEPALLKVHSPLMSPLVWDLGHIAAFEDLWLVHRLGGEPMVRGDLAAVYDAFETPRAGRGELPFLGPQDARAYLEEVRAAAMSLAQDRGIGDGRIHEMVTRHEYQHCETMLQTIQLARLEGYVLPDTKDSEPRLEGHALPSATDSEPPAPPAETPSSGRLEFVEVAAGPCTVGAPETGFAYDNERPRHHVELKRYLIGRTPVTNGDYLEFVTDGGYRRREWWSDAGWEWRVKNAVERPAGWTEDLSGEWRLGRFEQLRASRPVVHVSWFEADAFARAHRARLPTEAEWEKAASWDPVTAEAGSFPWGAAAPAPGAHGNFDQRAPGPVAVDAHPEGDSRYGVSDAIGQVWEWTASPFTRYPGFVADPYPEYSEVFFGPRFRVLKGGCWATRARVASVQFRNWDFPERRQIFAGIRLAK